MSIDPNRVWERFVDLSVGPATTRCATGACNHARRGMLRKTALWPLVQAVVESVNAEAAGRRSAVDAGDVIEMGLCEAEHVFLRPGRTYRFISMPGCARCRELADIYAQDNLPDPPSVEPEERGDREVPDDHP